MRLQSGTVLVHLAFQGCDHVHVRDLPPGQQHPRQRLHEPAVVLPVRLRHVPAVRGRPLGPRVARHHRRRRQVRQEHRRGTAQVLRSDRR